MKINQLKFGVYLSYASIFVTNITNLILTPFIIRSLGQSEYGLYMLIGAFVGYIAVLDFGLSNTTVRYVAKYRAERDREGEENFLSLTFIIYFLISLIVLIVGSILYINLDNIFGESLTLQEIKLAKAMFIILIINLALTLPMKSFVGIINAYERFVVPRLFTIIRTLIRALLIIVLLSLGYNVVAIVALDAILNLIMLLIYMAYAFLKLKVKIHLHNFDKLLIKEILTYSSLIFVSVIVDQLYWRIGHLVLGLVASTSEVAIFAIGMTFGQYFITFSTAISGVFLPKVTKMIVQNATNEELTSLLIKTGRLQFLILGLVLSGFILFGREFLLLWVGNGYEASWVVSLLVMLPLIVVLSQTVGISILQAKNMHGFRAVMYLAISIVNLFLSIYLAKIYGAIGAAIGTTLSLVLGNIIFMNFYYHFKVGINIPRFYKELYRGLIVGLLFSALIGLLISWLEEGTWTLLFLKITLHVTLYILIMWFIGMNSYEKQLFQQEFNKFTKKFIRTNKRKNK